MNALAEPKPQTAGGRGGIPSVPLTTFYRGDDEPVWGWCARCQTHAYFPHDCPGDGQVKDEDSEPVVP